MKQPDVRPRADARSRSSRGYLLLCLLFVSLTALTHPTIGQQSEEAPLVKAPPLDVSQVVQNLVQMNHRRLHALYTYEGVRTYRLEYRGFGGSRSAEMVVNVQYRSPGKKEFAVRSTTGSNLLIDQVLKKLLAAEIEAQDPDIQHRSALDEENYRFTLIGIEDRPAGMAYVVGVEPRRKDKFLYRGRIWIDATDFAVVRIEAEPAKNPSFWTKKTKIVEVYGKVSDFWLPESNRSASAIRLGGRAELSIDYEHYLITGSSQVSTLRQ